MSNKEAFLEAIIHSPHNDIPRLAYADWLDETAGGYDCRAEFIRVQCELAGWQPYKAPPDILEIANSGRIYAQSAIDLITEKAREYNARHESLQIRERELWSTWPYEQDIRFHETIPTPSNGMTWCILPESLTKVAELNLSGHNGPQAVVRRGFIEEIRLPLAEFIGVRCGCNATVRHIEGGCNRCGAQPAGPQGYVNGLATRLFREHPITRVKLTDRYHYTFNHVWLWSRETWHSHDSLPPMLYSLLPDLHMSPDGSSMKGFPSSQAAIDALSDACVEYGRKMASKEATHVA